MKDKKEIALKFIKAFSAIPDKQWHMGSFDNYKGARCALGHCRATPSVMSIGNGCYTGKGSAFDLLIKLINAPADINDGGNTTYQQNTPKERVIAALKDKVIEIDSVDNQTEINRLSALLKKSHGSRARRYKNQIAAHKAAITRRANSYNFATNV